MVGGVWIHVSSEDEQLTFSSPDFSSWLVEPGDDVSRPPFVEVPVGYDVVVAHHLVSSLSLKLTGSPSRRSIADSLSLSLSLSLLSLLSSFLSSLLFSSLLFFFFSKAAAAAATP